MHVLLAAPIVLSLLAVAGGLFRDRAARLRRLHRLVHAECRLALTAAAPDARPSLARFLPRIVLRNLRLLDIEPSWKDGGIVLATVALPVAAAGLILGPLAAVALVFVIGTVGYAVLAILAARYLAELGAQMPGFFDRVRQLLAVGNSLPTAFSRAVQGAQPRLAGFFAPALRRMGNGASFGESIRQSAEDIDLYEIRLFATAVVTNMRFGGSLNQSLGNLVSYLRKRASVERELRANTAQIRASAWVLGLLPMVVAGLIVFQNQDYARWFLHHPTGKRMLVYCIVSQIAGTFFMRRIVRTRF